MTNTRIDSHSRPTLTIVGLGPAGDDLLTQGTLDAISKSEHRFLRTSRHPSAHVMVSARSFDDRYETLEHFDDVYESIATTLLEATIKLGSAIYGVPGSPMVAERTVELLRKRAPLAGVDLVVFPALSFLDLLWVRLGVDPMAQRVTVVDAHRFIEDTQGSVGPFVVTQCHSQVELSEVKLALSERVIDPAQLPLIRVAARLGLPDESVIEVPWHELDRIVIADHLTSLYIPALPSGAGEEMAALENLMRTLRSRCPWDAEKDIRTLTPFVIEEANELVEAASAVVDAIGNDSLEASITDHYREELGDVLLQVLFHSCLAAEEGWFDLAGVLRNLNEKLVHRHPHVFPRDDFDASDLVTSEDIARNWNRIKNAPRA
jgi:tetrapyrrole methylase family protein / MazG family protein